LPGGPHVVIPTYYYNFVDEFVSTVKMRSFALNKEKMTFCFYFFRTFAPIFHHKLCRFHDGGARLFLALGRWIP